jgi:hypothetical protein
MSKDHQGDTVSRSGNTGAPDKRLLDALLSARKLLERCGPHLQGVEQECCGNYETDYGAEYMGQLEIVPVCCCHPIDLSDYVANELRGIDALIAQTADLSGASDVTGALKPDAPNKVTP